MGKIKPPLDYIPPPEQNEKPHLSWTQINMYLRCGMQYYFRYIKGLKCPPNNALLIGLGTHLTVEANMRYKLENNRMLPRDEIESRAHENVLRIADEDGVYCVAGQTHRYVVDESRRVAAICSLAHYDIIAPKLRPKYVEEPFKLKMPDFPYDIHGRIDLEEEPLTATNTPIIRDTKTTRMLKSRELAAQDQMTIYAAYALRKYGIMPSMYVDSIVWGTKKVRVVPIQAEREKFEIVVLGRRIAAMARALKKGIFLPSLSDQWWCNEKWCGYWHKCPYARRIHVSEGALANAKELCNVQRCKDVPAKLIGKVHAESRSEAQPRRGGKRAGPDGGAGLAGAGGTKLW